MPEIKQTKRAGKILQQAMQYCREYRHEFVMPEHLLLAMTDNYNFSHTLNIFNPSSSLAEQLEDQLEEIEMMPENKAYEPEASVQMAEVIEYACQQVINSSAQALDLPHLVMGVLHLTDSWACYLLKEALGDMESQFMHRSH